MRKFPVNLESVECTNVNHSTKLSGNSKSKIYLHGNCTCKAEIFENLGTPCIVVPFCEILSIIKLSSTLNQKVLFQRQLEISEI